jgi:predicted metalloprotease with PDZ domain
MLLTTSPDKAKVDARWSEFVCQEYFHAFNAKRLRPAELASLNYENPPRTSGLWVSEGLPT